MFDETAGRQHQLAQVLPNHRQQSAGHTTLGCAYVRDGVCITETYRHTQTHTHNVCVTGVCATWHKKNILLLLFCTGSVSKLGTRRAKDNKAALHAANDRLQRAIQSAAKKKAAAAASAQSPSAAASAQSPSAAAHTAASRLSADTGAGQVRQCHCDTASCFALSNQEPCS